MWEGTEAGERDHKILIANADEEEQSMMDWVRGKEGSTCGKDQYKTKGDTVYRERNNPEVYQ
jgi:hypothetical protein